MEAEHWKHENVNRNGTFKDRTGAVGTKPQLDVTWAGRGCTCGTCRNNDTYIRINSGRTFNGTVKGMTLKFESDEKLQDFLDEKEINLDINSEKKFSSRRKAMKFLEEKELLDIFDSGL